MEILKRGSKGESVKQLQNYFNLTPDGIFGLKTEECVKQFQKQNGLTEDGIVGQITWNKIFNTPSELLIKYNPLKYCITKLSNRTIKYIVIHYTAGSSSAPGTASNLKRIWETSKRASADFGIDDRDIVQFNPDINNYYCWAVGGTKYNNAGASLYKKATNSNTINIEMCSTLKKGTNPAIPNHEGWSVSDKVLENTIKLTKFLMKKYNIPSTNVIRHYDVTGKLCPGIIGWNEEIIYNTKKYNDNKEWIKFKDKLK